MEVPRYAWNACIASHKALPDWRKANQRQQARKAFSGTSSITYRAQQNICNVFQESFSVNGAHNGMRGILAIAILLGHLRLLLTQTSNLLNSRISSVSFTCCIVRVTWANAWQNGILHQRLPNWFLASYRFAEIFTIMACKTWDCHEDATWCTCSCSEDFCSPCFHNHSDIGCSVNARFEIFVWGGKGRHKCNWPTRLKPSNLRHAPKHIECIMHAYSPSYMSSNAHALTIINGFLWQLNSLLLYYADTKTQKSLTLWDQ